MYFGDDLLGSTEGTDDPVKLCNELRLVYAVSAEATIGGLLTYYCMVTMCTDESISQYVEIIGSLEIKLRTVCQTYNDFHNIGTLLRGLPRQFRSRGI